MLDISPVYLGHQKGELDPKDQDDEENIIQHILSVAEKRKEDAGEGEHDDMDAYDRERRDTKDPKTIGQRTKIVQQWWESLSEDREAEAWRAAEKWNKLHRYWRKNLPSMAREFIDTVQRTIGCHIVMFSAHEAGESQIKMVVFETTPIDGKKAFTESSESSKDWVLNGEHNLADYLLTAPVEEDLNEKQEVEITVDEEENPEVPSWSGQKLKVQQNLARAVFQAAYGRPKAKVPWGLLIKSLLEYLDKESIPDGFTMKDPSKWTKADMLLLWNHWHSQEGEDKVIVTFINCRKEDAPVHLQFEKKGKASAKKRWMSPGDDSEVDGGPTGVIGGSNLEQETVGSLKRGKVSPGRSGDNSPHETSPAWHASKDRLKFLKSLSIMPQYQELVELVHGLPKTAPGMGTKIDMPVWATWTWSAQYLPEDIHLNGTSFWKALQKLQSARFSCSLKGFQVVLGFGLLLRECKWDQEVDPDDPAVADLDFLLNSELGVKRGEDVMGAVGSVVSRLQKNSGYTKERDRGEGSSGKEASRVEEKMSGSEGGSEEEESPVPGPTNKRKRERSVNLKPEQKVTKGGHHPDVVQGKREQRARKQTKRALGLGL
ncbi:hypothetical protein EDC04DRAFT_2613711 [Pisolithus marmoratus]|nr:hypothetical protein EDC04DRAFT_2613711 [Pisolithus marmoratus]